jgi:hypothetical protein
MARFNEILVGRYNRFLQKLLSMKGGPPAPQLASEIAPTFEIESPPAESRYLLGWDRFGIVILQPAVAAVVGGIRLRNPVGSNVIAVLEKVQVIGNAVTDQPALHNGAATTDLSLVVNTALSRVDARGRSNTGLIASRSNAVSAPSLANILFQAATGNTQVNYDFILQPNQEIPILPGDAVQFTSSAANTACTVCILWRERLLEESERQ